MTVRTVRCGGESSEAGPVRVCGAGSALARAIEITDAAAYAENNL